MPRWPGPVLVIGGALLSIAALGAAELARTNRLDADPRSLAWLILVGIGLLVVGLVYASIRQVRVRSYLAPDRYRGPSIFLLFALAFAFSSAITLPFTADAIAIQEGRGEVTLTGSIVVLLALQAGLLGVGWLFVVRTNALAGLPLPGPNTAGAIRLGLVVGVAGWVVASVASIVVVVILQLLGISPTPQTAQNALALVEPWLAIVAIVIVAPIAEEAFFRGVIFNAWYREGGRRVAYLGSSLLFGVIHLSLVAFVPIVLLGLILAWIYERTRNLVAPIVVHAVFNGINVGIVLLERAGVVQLPT